MRTAASASWVAAILIVGALGGGCRARRAEVTTAAPKSPEVEAAGKIRLAESFLRAGRTSDAVIQLEQAIAIQPDNAGVRSYYGFVCFAAGRYAEAEAAFKKALEIDPYLTDAHNYLGALYDKMGRKDEAEKEFRIALEDPAYPTPEKVWLNLGLLYRSQGRDDEAIRALRKSVEISPKYFEAHFQLASLLDKTGKLDEAVREYEVAAPSFHNDVQYRFQLGFAYFRLGNREKARENLQRVLDLSPGSETAVKADEYLKLMR